MRYARKAGREGKIVEGVFSEETAWRLLRAMNEQQATGRTDVDVFPAAVAKEVEIDPDTNTFFAVVGYLEAEDYIDPSPNATLVGTTVFRITDRGIAWLETPPGV